MSKVRMVAVLLAGLGVLSGCAGRESAADTDAELSARPVRMGIEGAVRGLDGKPVPLVSVWCAPVATPGGEPSESSSGSTLEDGTFRFEGLKAGRYRVWTLRIYNNQLLSSETEAEVREDRATAVELSFEDYRELSGTIRVGGQPLRPGEARVDFLGGEGIDRSEATLTEVGEYSIFLRPGEYRLGVMRAPFGLRTAATVTVAAGDKPMRRDFDLPAADLTILLRSPEGESFQGGMLTTDYETFSVSETMRIQLGQPEYLIRGLLPGTYRVGATTPSGLQGISGPIVVGKGGTQTVNIDLVRPSDRVFHGRFTLPKGRYEYKFFSPADIWQDDILNPQKVGEGVLTNSIISVPGGSTDGDGKRSVWPAVNDTTGEVAFWVALPTLSDEVYVRGSFNQWRTDPAWKLTQVPEATYEISVKLPPGMHEYKVYSTDDVWWLDRGNQNQAGAELEINNVVVVPGPGAPATSPDRYPRFDEKTGLTTFRVPVSTLTGEVYLRGTFNNWESKPDFRMKKSS